MHMDNNESVIDIQSRQIDITANNAGNTCSALSSSILVV